MIIKIAENYPEYSFVLVGPIYEETVTKNFLDYSNIYLLGHKAYEELPDYLRTFNVCMVPYCVNNEYMKKVFPMKFFSVTYGSGICGPA